MWCTGQCISKRQTVQTGEGVSVSVKVSVYTQVAECEML